MIYDAIFTEETPAAAPQAPTTLQERMDHCAAMIKMAFDNNDMDLFKYALNKYSVNLRITPAEPNPPTHQSSATDAPLADPEE